MADIVVSEFMDEAALEAALSRFEVIYDPTLVDHPEHLMDLLPNARALIVRNRTQVRGPLLEAAASLQVVGRLGVGLDNIDLEACEGRGIKVCPASGANDLSVAEYVVTAALVLLRGAYFASPEVATGAWPRNRLIGREMSGKVLGLIGYGAIARETAARATALGMQIIGYDPYLPNDDPRWGATKSRTFDQLLTESDVVSLHVPLTNETADLISEPELAKMRPDAILINAARGGVIHIPSMLERFNSGKLGGFALDVFDKEPFNSESGIVFPEIGNFILTPHIAGVTEESNVRVSEVTVSNVLSVLEGS